MAKIKFTAGRVDGFQCENGKSQSFLWDAAAPGLGLGATANGAKFYMFQAKLNGQAMRITIGAPGTWTIQEAQAEACRLKVIIDNGQDPRQVKAAGLEAEQNARDAKQAEAEAKQNQARHQTLTLGTVWPLYVESRRKRWSEWHIRDHENDVRVGGVQKVRGKGFTEPGPLASLPDLRKVLTLPSS